MSNKATLIPVKKGEVRNPNGRPKKLFTQITNELKQLGYERVTSGNITEAYELFFSLNKEQIIKIVENDETPMILRIVGKSLLSKQGFEILEKMIDRVHGKVPQRNENINLNINTESGFEMLTEAEKQAKIDHLRRCIE